MDYQVPVEFSANLNTSEITTEAVGPCEVCNGNSFTILAQNMDFELRTCRNIWRFRQCTNCGHVQLDSRPTALELPIIYPPSYYSYDMGERINPIALWGKGILDKAKFSRFLRYMPNQPRTYLDIGSGDGKYLRQMNRFGLYPENLYGLELDDRAVQRARRDGFQVFCERVENANSIPERSIDLATMFHVIEHVASPRDALIKIGRWLKPNGCLVLETPNTNALDFRLFRGEFWGGYHTPRHWHLFNEDSLKRLLAETGYEIIALEYQTGHSFWMYSFHHLLRYNRVFPAPRIAKIFDPAKGLPILMIVTVFDLIRSKLGAATSSMLVVARPVRNLNR